MILTLIIRVQLVARKMWLMTRDPSKMSSLTLAPIRYKHVSFEFSALNYTILGMVGDFLLVSGLQLIPVSVSGSTMWEWDYWTMKFVLTL